MARPRRFSKHLAPLVVVGVVLGLQAAPAWASTAQLIELVVPGECKYLPPGGVCEPGSSTVLSYEAGPGEANRVRVALAPGGIRIADTGAEVEPGPGCSSIDARSVRCTAPQYGIFVATGDGADRLRLGLEHLTIADGGAGDDVLVGGRGRDRLYGGKGADVLRGGDGHDELYDGSLRRPLRAGDHDPFVEYSFLPVAGAGRGRDYFDGGPGRDGIGYQGRQRGVRVDLADSAAIGGARREGDSVIDVETAVGGDGDDRLGGTRRTDWLEGGDGDDRIRSGRGVDQIDAGAGRNVIFAGPGDDAVSARQPGADLDLGADRIFCGPGEDRVYEVFPTDFLHDDCEVLGFPALTTRAVAMGTVVEFLPLARGGSLMVLSAADNWCTYPAGAPSCLLELAILVEGPGASGGTAPARGTVLGSASYTILPNERKHVSLSLSAEGARILRRHRALRVRIRVTEGDSLPARGYLTILRAPS